MKTKFKLPFGDMVACIVNNPFTLTLNRYKILHEHHKRKHHELHI